MSQYFHKPVQIIQNPEQESIEITETEWFQKTSQAMSPASFVAAGRWKASMTQKELGIKLGISAQNVSEIERGKRSISIKMARKLALIFHTDMAEFLEK